MTKKTKNATISLSAALSKDTTYSPFKAWLVGNTPLIVHAWSEKARRAMLEKHVKAVSGGGKEIRDPEAEYLATLYGMDDDGTAFGFPVTGIKNAIQTAAHKDKGIARTTLRSSLWLDSHIVRQRPALAGAICDMPLVRIFGSDPEMREDMVRIGTGLSKTANLAYRAQFAIWAIQLTGRLNEAFVPSSSLAYCINESGISCGIGEWRPEKGGIFGCYHLATTEEEAEWTAFAEGKGELPVPDNYSIAA